MILLLTYHKVLPQLEDKEEFYTIRIQQLERHLELLQQNGFRFLTPEDLLTCDTALDRNVRAPSVNSCLLSFDDGTADHLHVVLPMLERFNSRALFFVPTSKLNRPGYLAVQEIGVLARAGHAIGSHSHEHRRMDQLPEEDIRVQLELSRQILGDILSVPTVFFAPPGGFLTPMVCRVAFESGLRLIRTMRWGYNRRLDPSSLECIPLNRYTTEADFCRILQGRSKPLIYTGKELLKKLVPTRVYESFRTGVFGILGRN